jgi:hypothetical protein
VFTGLAGKVAIVSTVRPSGGAGAWDFASLDQRTYPPEAGWAAGAGERE